MDPTPNVFGIGSNMWTYAIKPATMNTAAMLNGLFADFLQVFPSYNYIPKLPQKYAGVPSGTNI